jgi:HD-like signal output (HDOD) protein
MNEIRGLTAWMRALSDQELPTLNAVVRAICELSEDDDSSTNDLTKIILRDADLTSKVLKIANSVHYNRSFSQIKTVSRAIIQLGFINIKNITLTSSLIDSFLQGKPRQLLIGRLAKSFHAAVQARAMVSHLDNDRKEQVFIAALLRHIGELAILSTGREAAENFISARDANPESERELAIKYLGVDIAQLNKALIREWSLGELVSEACERSNHPSALAQAVNLGNELSQHIHKGMVNADIVRLCAEVGELCDISTDDANKQVLMMAEEASVIATTYGAEILLSSLPDRATLNKKVVAPVRTGYEFQQYLNQIHKFMLEGESLSRLMQCAILALHEGSGIARVAIAMMDYKNKCLEFRYVAGEGTSKWPQHGRIELERLHKGELLHEFLRSQHTQWHQPADIDTPIGNLKLLGNDSDCMIGALKTNKRIVAVVYADAAGGLMNARQFEDFRLIVNQLNMILLINANNPTAE